MLPRLKFVLLVGAVLATGASAAFAEMGNRSPFAGPADNHRGFGGGRSSGKFLYEFDLNHDGKVTKDEFNRAEYQRFTTMAGGGKLATAQQYAADSARKYRDRETKLFRRADWNGDGKLTLDEYMAPLRAKFSGMDRAGVGALDCSHRARFQAARADRDGNGKAKRRGRSARGLCTSSDLNMDGKATRAEFDKANMQKFEAAVHGGKTLSFDQFAAVGSGRFADVNGRIFHHLDANNDGKLTLAEYAAPAQKQFARMDRNNDGTVTRDELSLAPQRSGFHGGHNGRPFAPRS